MDENRGQVARDPQETDGISMSTEQEQLISTDRALSAVANEQRRAIIDTLNSESEKTLDYDTLVDRVAERVRDEDRERDADEHRKRVRIALHHSHLPKLEEVQIIDYDEEMGQVQFGGDELVQELLSVVQSYDTDE